MPASLIAIYLLAALGMVLGFVALIMQKIYLDPATNMPTSVELPALGKISTNYPALLFLFFGAGLAGYAFNSSMTTMDDWTITGHLRVDETTLTAANRERLAHIKWDVGGITLIPTEVTHSQIDPTGTFEIGLKIPRALTFEDAIQVMKFDHHPDALGDLMPKTAVAEKKLKQSAANFRDYDFVVLPADR